MYIPPAFNDSNPQEVREFISENSFGILINTVKDRIWATHIPLIQSENDHGQDVLIGHISRGNRQWNSFDANDEVLVIFQGPHSYVSSSWYDHANVPTWNYAAVHVYGSLNVLEGDRLKSSLEMLMSKYEHMTDTHLNLSDLPPDLVSREMKGIVGFEIVMKEVKAAFKMSQNRNDKSYDSITSHLDKHEIFDAKKVSEIMKNRR